MSDDHPAFLQKLFTPLAFTSVIASAGGIAMMIRHKSVIRRRDVVAAVLASCSACAIVFLLLQHNLEEEPGLLYGVSGLSGVGGATTLDLLLLFTRRWAAKQGLLKEDK